MSVSKQRLFKTLGIKNGSEYKKIKEHRKRKSKNDSELIELLQKFQNKLNKINNKWTLQMIL